MNAGAAEWTPSVAAAEWTPGGGEDSWEDQVPAAPTADAAAPDAAPDAAPATEEEELVVELKELLAAGEINESEFVEALLEAEMPVDPEMKARVDAAKKEAAARAEQSAPAKVEGKPKAKAEAEAQSGAAAQSGTNKSSGESKNSGKSSKAVKAIPVNKKESKHPPPDPRPHLNVVFIGHVDAGKSTIAGTVMFLTGNVDQRDPPRANTGSSVPDAGVSGQSGSQEKLTAPRELALSKQIFA